MSTELVGPQVCPDLGSWGPRGPELEVYECDKTTTHTHTIRRDCMLDKPQSLSLHAKPVWNPVKLQGFIDSQRHIWKKREAMYKVTFYPASKNSKTSQANGPVVFLSASRFGYNLFISDFNFDSDFYLLVPIFVILLESETKPKYVESKNFFIFSRSRLP